MVSKNGNTFITIVAEYIFLPVIVNGKKHDPVLMCMFIQEEKCLHNNSQDAQQ